jgi:hypothetical protein
VSILDKVRDSSDLQDLLFDLCDFEMPPSDYPLPRFRDGSSPRAFGRNGAGGSFCLGSGPDGTPHAVLYISTEGEAGVVAGSLDAFFATIAAIPYWIDCLDRSGGASLDAMRLAAANGEREFIEEIDGFAGKRKRLQKLLGLPVPTDALGLLHRAVSVLPPPVVFDDQGNGYVGLFGPDMPD